MRKLITLMIALLIITGMTGCDAVQRKFTRKKKYTKPVPRIHQIKKYDIKPSVALYNTHYAYWHSWMSELIQDLGQNHKRDVVCISEALNQLYDMQNMLVQERADAMDKHVHRLEEVKETIAREDLSQYNKSWVTMTLEREDRAISREFDGAGVKKYIKASFEDAPKTIKEPDAPAASAFSASLPREY